MNQGTILADLLEYSQKLISKGNSSTAYKLREVIQNSSVKSEKEAKKPTYALVIISGGLLAVFLLLIGYW
jgi:hypothetical protein